MQKQVEDLFEIFSNSFYGYGRYRAPFWFVGPYASILTRDGREIARRLEFWHRRGQPRTVDLPGFHSLIGDDRWTGAEPRLHRVWSRLSRICAVAEGRKADQDVRSFQATELGSLSGSNAVIHVLPVECHPDAPWPFEGAERHHLKRPDLYVERFGERRLRDIARHMQRNSPPVVVFYDLTHRSWWERLAGGTFQTTRVRDCFVTGDGSRLCLMVRHPESIGTRNEYFDGVGRLIRELREEAHT